MAFFEGKISECVRYGYRGGSTFNTMIVSVNSGAEQRNGLWANGRGEWEIQYVQGYQGMKDLQDFFIARQGMLQGFRFKDWLDYKDDGKGVLVDSTTYGKMFLVKQYSTGSAPYYIRKPNSDIKVYKNGVLVPATVDTTTGEVTFSGGNSSFGITSISENSGKARVVVNTQHGLITGQIVAFSNATGDWSFLNSKTYAVTVISLNSFDIQENVTGLSGSGYGVVQVKPSVTGGTYTWTGTFDKPVRFNTDSFNATIADKDAYAIDSLPIIEIKDYL